LTWGTPRRWPVWLVRHRSGFHSGTCPAAGRPESVSRGPKPIAFPAPRRGPSGAPGTVGAYLASRQEVGRLLAASGVPTIEFRASIVIGSGSLSFEMIRALVERLPVMVAPRWVRTPTQPIAVEDLIAYLLASGRRVLSFSLCHSPRWRHLSRFISSARGTYFSKMASSLLESWLN
jgi:hypothetical protein